MKANKTLTFNQTNTNDQQALQELKNKLYQLALFITVWKDETETLEIDPTINKKWLRQQIKFKSSLDKDDRYAINISLQSMVFILCEQINYVNLEKYINEFKQLDKKNQLISFISRHVDKLNQIQGNKNFQVTQYLLNEEQEIKKIGAAISDFQTPNKKKKLLKYFGKVLAFITSLGAGLSTGGAIFLLFSNPILGIILGGLIFGFGFFANYAFFSKNVPDFFINLLKKRSMSQYWDQEGNSQQLSAIKKYLFIPIAVFASLAVGAGTVGLTYTTVIALAAKLLPLLPVILAWPPLPLIIAGILSVSIGLTLTVAVLTATITAIKDSKNFSWLQLKEKLKNLTVRKIVSYVFKGLLVLIGLFGLAYFRFTSGIDLTNVLQPLSGPAAAMIISAIIGVIAYIPQAFFTVISTQKLIRVFSSTSEQITSVDGPQKDFFSRLKSRISTIYPWLPLIANASGNAALVVVDNISVLSISGAVGCFCNSWSANLIEPNRNLPYRNQTNAAFSEESKEASTLTTTTTALNIPKNQSLIRGVKIKSLEPSGPFIINKSYLSRSQSEENLSDSNTTNISRIGFYSLLTKALLTIPTAQKVKLP